MSNFLSKILAFSHGEKRDSASSAEFEAAVNAALLSDTVSDATKGPYISEEGALNLSTRKQVLRIAINIYRSKLGQLPESACIEEYNERAQTASVRLEYISDLIEPAIVEINLKRNKVRLIFTRCEDAANLYDFNSRFNDNVKTL